jgi:opacity protein-like surface antigen
MKFAIGAEFKPVHGRIEPYGGVGLGVYYFTKDVSLRNWLDEEVDSRKICSETDFGWNLNGGVRLYFGKNIGASIDIEYDNIVGMESLKAEGGRDDAYLESSSVDSEFISIFVGVHFRIQ